MALTHAQKTGLEAAIFAYLAAEGGRFARTVAAFKEEAQGPGNEDQGNLVVSGGVMEKAWAMVHHGLKSKSKARTEAVFDAIESGDLAEVQLCECVGVDVKALRDGEDKASPLLCAAFFNRLEMVQHFVRSGHDMDMGANNGAAPLHLAAQEGHIKVVQYLVEQGADKDKADDNGTTPFIAACHTGHMDVAEYLLDQGCDVNQASNEGWTALHWAAYHGRLDLAQVLFRFGVKLDARTNDGETPADIATRRGHHAFADAIRAEEIRRRDHGFKRDRSTIEGTEEHEAAKRPRVEEEAKQEEAVDESDDDDDDDDDDVEEEEA